MYIHINIELKIKYEAKRSQLLKDDINIDNDIQIW